MATLATRFWTYIVILIPSVLCTLFVLYYLLFDRTLRRALNNHVIAVVLVIGLICLLTIYPWMLYYYQLTSDWERPPIFCATWKFIDWGLYTTHTMLFAWATIERHILIFHDRWVSTRRKRLLVHYLPLVVLLMYCLVFYVVLIFFPPCRNSYYNFLMICLFPCYSRIRILQIWDSFIHQIVPYVLILLFSGSLFARVLWQKYLLRHRVEWRRYRKMTIQLLSIALLYLLFFFPLVVGKILGFFKIPSPLLTYEFVAYADYLSYLVIPLFPFICVMSLSDLRKKLSRLFHCRRRFRAIFPETRRTRAALNAPS